MPRSAHLLLVVLSLAGLTACSKKQEETPPPAATPQAETPADVQAPAETAANDTAMPPPREFDFSGKSSVSNTGPASPAAAVKPGEPEAAPSGEIEVRMPVMIEYYPPFYPIGDRMRGTEGRLLVGLFVTETGAVEAPEIISSTMPAYAEEVLKAAAAWRFTPALHEGKPIRFPVRIPVSFVSEFGSAGMPPGSPLENLVLSGDTYYVVGADGKYSLANIDVTPLTRVQPVFAVPEGVKELRVTLKFRVDEHGRVVNPEVTESSNAGFDQAALKAIGFWQFLPKLKDGKPVPAAAKLPLRISR